MNRKLRKRRFLLIVVGLAVVAGASFPFLLSASCLTRPQTPGELNALVTLRNMTRGGVLPSEEAVAGIESRFPNTKAAALARVLRARIRLNSKDFAGAAQLLDAAVIREQSALSDYALFLRANAFEEAGRLPEARATYLQLVNDYSNSLRTREATLRVAALMNKGGESAAIPLLLRDLVKADDAEALIITARAYEQSSDLQKAIATYRRLYFFVPESDLSSEAANSLTRLGSSSSPGAAEEAIARADKLYAARKFNDAYSAFTQAFSAFPATATPQNQLRRGIAAYNVRKLVESVAALTSVPSSASEIRAEALFYLAQAYARQRQWQPARAIAEEIRKNFPSSNLVPRTLVALGQIAKEAKNAADANFFLRNAITSYSDSLEVAQAQFDLAWEAHEAKNYVESSRMLTEHLAFYADRNTDNRGRAGYWAARDSERAGKLSEARAIYEGVIRRYDANWYGYLAKQRLDAMRNSVQSKTFAPDSTVGRAVTNLQIVTVAEETAGPAEEARIVKADQLSNVGFIEWALKELSVAGESGPDSPKVNLAIAQIYRFQEDNVRALNTLRRSYPDYAQMKPEELTREEWDVFYPLAHWDIIVQESRGRGLDPFQVAGLIRQETIFSSRARSSANAYGLMQVLVPTARLTAKKYGVNREITPEALYEPRLNIQLGTAYLKDQIDKFGKIEYVAAAYNAGPLRAVRWRESLPAEMDEWSEAVPFKETRGYVQGVVRNRLQYLRLYDDKGEFRPEVGTRPVSGRPSPPGATPNQLDPNVRKRRVTGGSTEE